jgi:replication factor C subunit 1
VDQRELTCLFSRSLQGEKMDIRKFFGKADDKKKPVKKKPSAANADTAQSAPAAAPKRKENDGMEEPEIRASLTDPSPPKKQKSEDDRVEVTKEDFFRHSSSEPKSIKQRLPKEKAREPPKNQEEWVEWGNEETEKRSPEPTWVEVSKDEVLDDTTESNREAVVSASSSPSQGVGGDYKKESPKPSSQKKRRLIIEEEDDDDEDDDDNVAPRKPSTAVKKAKRVSVIDDDDDDDDKEEEYAQEKEGKSPKAKKKTPSSKEETPKKETAKKALKKSPKPTPSSKVKSKKAADKESLIQPDVNLTSFSADDAVPECLSGTTFVFSGVLENLSREASEDLIKTLGGRVTSAISGKTDYLVVGDELEDGRPYTQGSKYKKATEGGVIIVKGEEKLYGLIKSYNDRAKAENPREGLAAAAKPAATQMPSNPYAKRPANPYVTSNSYARSAAKPGGTTNPYAAKSSSIAKPLAAPTVKFDSMSLWADRYAPQTTRDILGNQENVKKLTICKFFLLLYFMNFIVY